MSLRVPILLALVFIGILKDPDQIAFVRIFWRKKYVLIRRVVLGERGTIFYFLYDVPVEGEVILNFGFRFIGGHAFIPQFIRNSRPANNCPYFHIFMKHQRED